jgi:hypothetical protein
MLLWDTSKMRFLNCGRILRNTKKKHTLQYYYLLPTDIQYVKAGIHLWVPAFFMLSSFVIEGFFLCFIFLLS